MREDGHKYTHKSHAKASRSSLCFLCVLLYLLRISAERTHCRHRRRRRQCIPHTPLQNATACYNHLPILRARSPRSHNASIHLLASDPLRASVCDPRSKTRTRAPAAHHLQQKVQNKVTGHPVARAQTRQNPPQSASTPDAKQTHRPSPQFAPLQNSSGVSPTASKRSIDRFLYGDYSDSP